TRTPSTLPAQIDREKIERVLLNLLSNAIKFTPDGGTIRCDLTATDGMATLSLQDSGPGVPMEHRQPIFGRFRQLDGGPTRRFGGTGLGLAIVKDFIALHGGTISVGDAPEGGALFTIELPLLAPADVSVAPAPVADSTEDEDTNLLQTLEELREL